MSAGQSSSGGGPASVSVSARAERALVIGVLLVRATFTVQLVLTVGEGMGSATRPGLFVVLSALMIAEFVALCGWLWRRLRLSGATTLADLAFVSMLMAAEPLYTAPDDRVGTWVAWAFGAAAATSATVGVGFRRWTSVTFGGLVLAGGYLGVSLTGALSTGRVPTALTNAVGVLGFTLSARLVAGFIRDLALTADKAREQAAQAARRAELERQRTLLHDQASVLSLLSRAEMDPDIEAALKAQAARGSRRIRAFLATDDRDYGVDDLDNERPVLRTVVALTCGEFSDLPLTVNVDLLGDRRVDRVTAAAITDALRTVLHNVRRHAEARSVTVHGDASADGAWDVTVLDDGVGFEPATASYGFGLRVQAGSALRRLGVEPHVDSAPGEGTQVRFCGYGHPESS